MLNNISKSILQILFLSIIAGCIFLFGRYSVNQTSSIMYVKGETITNDSIIHVPIAIAIRDSFPYPVHLPPEIIYIHDSIDKPVVIDTSAIIQDYIALRKYDMELFNNDSIGIMNIHADVQYNSLQRVDYTYTPMQKVVTQYQHDIFSPFVFGGLNTELNPSIGAGAIINKMVVMYEYQYNQQINKSQHGIKIGIKL